MPRSFVVAPTLLAIGISAWVFVREPSLASVSLPFAMLLGALGILGPRATRVGRLLLILPPSTILLITVLAWASETPEVVFTSWIVAGVMLFALTLPDAPPRSRKGTGTVALFVCPIAVRPSILALDDGGLRVDHEDLRRYLPFAALAPPRFDPMPSGPSVLVLEEARGRFALELVLETEAHAHATRFVEAIDAARKAMAEPTVPVPQELLREGATLDAWQARLEAWAGPAYRGRGVDVSLMNAIFANPRATVEARAAAAFVLASSGNASELEARVSEETPPLVLAMLARAPDTRRLVTDDIWVEARSYLPPEDQKQSGGS